MEFRTEIKQLPFSFWINHQSKIMMLGSCFSENVGLRLQKYKFQCTINPFGTIFNPISIAKLINWSLTEHTISADDLVQNQEVYYHLDMHSNLSDNDPLALTELINHRLSQAYSYLKSNNVLFITLGSSIAYLHNERGEIVANCHKIPQALFTKKILSINESFEALTRAFDQLESINPTIKIVLTVSPVRHTRNGIIEDHRSKARIIELCHSLTETLENVSYFPAYEIMMDDLRDYRFYEKDLIHPNEIAIDYIWGKFSNLFFDQNTQNLNSKIEKILTALNHKARNIESIQHQAFLIQIEEEINMLKSSFPHFRF